MVWRGLRGGGPRGCGTCERAPATQGSRRGQGQGQAGPRRRPPRAAPRCHRAAELIGAGAARGGALSRKQRCVLRKRGQPRGILLGTRHTLLDVIQARAGQAGWDFGRVAPCARRGPRPPLKQRKAATS